MTPIALLTLAGGPVSAADATASGCTSILALRLCTGLGGRAQPPVTVPPTPVTVPPLPPVTLPTTTTAPPRAVNDLLELVPQLLALMNADRAVAGLPPFRTRADVNALAQQHSRDMAAKHEIWHNDDYFSSATRSALAAGVMGQNVALNHSVPGAELAFMASPHHRDNVLDGRFSVVGLGVATDERGMFYVTQDFIQPKGTPRAVAAAKPATAAAPRLTTQTAGAKRKTTPAVGTPKAPAETSPSDVLGASIAVDAVVLPDSAPPRAEVAVPASTTFRLTPISERSNDNSVVLLALLLLVASGVPAVRQIRSEREYAKVR